MIQVERGADITEMEAPIPNTIRQIFPEDKWNVVIKRNY